LVDAPKFDIESYIVNYHGMCLPLYEVPLFYATSSAYIRPQATHVLLDSNTSLNSALRCPSRPYISPFHPQRMPKTSPYTTI